eukprot:m.2782 g.2782  ORF g.2782 m.2782 type:complete len:155 (+) comp4089_c0_seq1:46-510(+)
MLFFTLALSAMVVCSQGMNTVNLFSDSACDTLTTSFNITMLTDACQRQDFESGTRSVSISSVACKDGNVGYVATSYDSDDCSGDVDGSPTTIAFTAAEYKKFLAGSCATQVTDGDNQYIKITGDTDEVDFCSSSAIIAPSLLLMVVALTKALGL